MGSHTLKNRHYGLVFNGAPGDTIFDITFGGAFGTAGSFRGTTFLVTFGLGSLDVVGTYRDEIKLTAAAAAVGDLWRELDINFDAVAGGTGGLASGTTLKFVADTDNTELAGDIVAVIPEPSSIALLITGGLFLVGYRQRKQIVV